MIQETELNLFVPSPELLVRLASGDRPLGINASPPRIRVLRETYFDTADQALRRRGMTCKLRQAEGDPPDLVVTVGESPDSEGITSRSRLTASAIGVGVFETLRGDSEPAVTIRKFVDPAHLRPQIALDIQRLGRTARGGILRQPILHIYFDRITVQMGGASTVFHELRIRRRRKGGPLIRDLAHELRDRFHLFPDGLSTLQRAYRILAMEKKTPESELSPYSLSLALAVFKDGSLALRKRGGSLCIPSFRGSGEDAARALCADLLGNGDLRLERLGTTEGRPGRPVVEIWAAPDPALDAERDRKGEELVWYPWHSLLEEVGREGLTDPALISALLLLTRRRLMGKMPWVPRNCGLPRGEGAESPRGSVGTPTPGDRAPCSTPLDAAGEESVLSTTEALLPLLSQAEDRSASLAARLEAASRLTLDLSRLFMTEVASLKGDILSADSSEANEVSNALVALVSIRVRGMVDRLYQCVTEDFMADLESADIQIRGWTGLMFQDRKALLELLETRYLPSMRVAPEWGPSFVPEMPSAGCAVGVFARTPGREAPRFLHLVLGPDTPSFFVVPGSTTVVSLEEVVLGYLAERDRHLERADSYLFRFTTGEVSVRMPVTGTTDQGREGVDGGPEGPIEEQEPEPEFVESHQSVVVRVLVHRRMPESHQAQLLRALERQVSRRNPLIGWCDIYPVPGPLDLSGIDELLRLKQG